MAHFKKSSHTKSRKFFWTPTFAGVTLLCLALGIFSPAHAAEPTIGQTAPPLAAKELNGTAFDLSAEHGKVVIVHFWSTWCPSCHEEMAVLEKFNKEYGKRGIEIIAVSLDKPRKRDEVQAFMQAFSFPAVMLSDTSANGFGSPGSIPVTYIVDGRGILRAHLTPEDQILSMKGLEEAVKPLLTP